MIKNTMLALGAVALASTPVLAQSVMTPSVAPLNGEEMGAEGSSGILIGLAAAAVVVGGIILIADDNDDPVSR